MYVIGLYIYYKNDTRTLQCQVSTKVIRIISMLVHTTHHTGDLPDAVLRQGFRIISNVEYLGTAMVIQHIQ